MTYEFFALPLAILAVVTIIAFLDWWAGRSDDRSGTSHHP